MNKRGFTLIELMAVVVILAAIAAITIPIISNSTKKSKEAAEIKKVELYINAIDQSIVDAQIDNKFKIQDGCYEINSTGDICLDGECSSILEVNAKNKPVSGTVCFVENRVSEIDNIVVGEKVYGYTESVGVRYLYKAGTMYTVTFNSNGGKILSVTGQSVAPGKKVTRPEDPTRLHYKFTGWLLNGEPYDFDNEVTSNMTLVASWEEIPQYTLVEGTTFNMAIKTLVKGSNVSPYSTPDETVEYIKFYSVGELPEGYTLSQLQSLPSTTVSNSGDTIKAYYNSTNKTVYVYSEGEINWNSNTTDMFAFFKSLKTLEIPDGVTNIGWGIFSTCTSLTSVTIPDSVTTLGDYAFTTCSSLKSVKIPDGVTRIGLYVFYRCSSLTSVTISANVNRIGMHAFDQCSSLTSVIIPDSVTYIDAFAFNQCSNLASVTMSNSVTTLGNMAFNSCKKLTSITLPDSLTTMEDSVFSYCTALTSITIPSNVTKIGKSTFSNCTSLTGITFSEPSGWWYADSSSATEGTSLNLSNASTNVTYFKTTYVSKYWKRTGSR